MKIEIEVPVKLRKRLSPTGKALQRKATSNLIFQLLEQRAAVYSNGHEVPVEAVKDFIRSKKSIWFLDYNVSSADELELCASALINLLSDLNDFLVEKYNE